MDDESLLDHRWAFGTGFVDPFAIVGLDEPTDDPALVQRCLMLGDDALIYSHRLQEWVTHLPELEEETALANIALDLLGQARLLLTRAGHAEGFRAGEAVGGKYLGPDEDKLAFFRLEHEFRNVRLVEAKDGDFAELVARQLVFSTWRLAMLQRLRASADPGLAAIAGKAATELAYHREYAEGWVLRLGDGTQLSRARMQAGLEAVWPYVEELFLPDPALDGLPAELADPASLRAEFDAAIDAVVAAATLARPSGPAVARIGGRTGRDGVHTEALSHILAELQSVARAHPLGTW
ncbi:MAG TPA: 1,2-phenylacetyl-CoA epoxidase subunit PaaC [Micromonosporaceae bacterium]|jgi:ring-1,2-phenylacetyl-CoA epoxidase subunit PaaC